MASHPLTEPQRLIWVNEHVFPGTSLHVIACAALIDEPVDLELLNAAIEHYVAGAPALRTRIAPDGGACRQAFDPSLGAAVETLDLRDDDDPRRALAALGERVAREPFRLEEGERLFAIVVALLAGGKTGLLIKVHHLIADAYSLFLFLRGVSRHYRSLLERGVPRSGEAADFAALLDQEAEYRTSARCELDRAFWSERLATLEQGTLLGGTDLTAASTAGHRLTFAWPEELVQRLKPALAADGASLYGGLMGLLGSVLGRTLGRSRVCIGTPFVNRSGLTALKTFGMCVNTLPVVLHAPRESSLREYVARAAVDVAASLRSGRFPFRLARPFAEPARAGQPLFDVGLSYQNADLSRGLELRVEHVSWFFPGHEMNALTLHAHDRSRLGELRFDVDYRTSVFSEAQVRALFGALTSAAEDRLARPDAPWGSLPLSAPSIRRGPSIPGARPAPPGFVTDWIARVAADHPERVALRCGERRTTYAELLASALRARDRLHQLGVTAGDAVLVLARRAPETVAAILGILFAGAAYVPIALGTPAQRLKKIQSASSARLLLAPPGEARPDVPGLAFEAIALAPASSGLEAPATVGAKTQSYVLFTSGSTGEPKGVVVDHEGLRHYLRFAVAAYGDGGPIAMPLFTSLGFDLTVTSLFLPLVTGGTLHVYPDGMDDEGTTLEVIFGDDACDVVKMTPSHLRLVDALALSARRVRAIVVGGEQLPHELVARVAARLGPGVRFVNEYGPTEAVVGCVHHLWSSPESGRARAVVPIGLPIPETPVRVTTPWGQHQLPGFPGELEVGGAGLAQGYLNDPEQTAARFVVDGDARWYRTGDVVEEADGLFHCLGRRDRQIKWLGYRIELADLEAALRSHPSVTESYALHALEEKQLLLFYTGEPSPEAALLEHLREHLPAYAVPSAVVHCASFPLNAHGKVDEASLRERFRARAPSSGEDALPAGELEGRIAAIVAEVLAIAPAILEGRTFAAAGGDSVNAIHVLSRLRALGIASKVSDLVGAPSVADFVRRAALSARPAVADDGAPEDGVLDPPLPMQRWFLDQRFAEEHHYHQSILVASNGPVDREAAQAALHAVVVAHDALRLNLDPERRLFFNPEHLARPPAFEAIAVPDGPEGAAEAFVAAESARIKRGFDPTKDPLIRGACFATTPDRALVLLCAHHLAVDVASWFVLWEDWVSAYRAHRSGAPIALKRAATSVRARANALAGQTLPPAAAAHWARVRAAVEEAPAIDTRHAAPASPWVEERWTHAPRAGTFFDASVHLPYATEPHELVLTAFSGALASFFGVPRVVVAYEGHGRDEVRGSGDVLRTVGWFTRQFPLVFDAPPDGSPGDWIARVKDGLRAVPEGGDMGTSGATAGRLPALKFNFLGRALQLTDPEFQLSPLDTGPDRSPAGAPPEMLEAVVSRGEDDRCHVRLTFHGAYFDAADRQRFREELDRWCERLLAHCLGRTGRAFTASDFPTAGLNGDDLSALFDDS